MVDTLEKALALRSLGTGDFCIGERDSVKPPGFDFGDSPVELARADVVGNTLIQTTSNGTAGINAARGADRIYAGTFVRRTRPCERQRPRWMLGIYTLLSKACRPVFCERMLSKRPIVTRAGEGAEIGY
jgi:hypothetical protein